MLYRPYGSGCPSSLKAKEYPYYPIWMMPTQGSQRPQGHRFYFVWREQTTSELLNSAPVVHLRHLLRTHSPLVHCMTNDVAQTLIANVLLAVGISPAMVIDPREAVQFATIADAPLINIGTLTENRVVAMRATVEHTCQAGRPWTLDPVAVGVLIVHTALCHELLALQPTTTRGNASEILALAGMSAGGCEVDTTDMAAVALPTAQTLARQLATVVVITGEVDYVIDGEWVLSVAGGNPLMTRVVGIDCALSVVAAASAALSEDWLESMAAVCGLVKQAGGITARQGDPGSFIPAFLDALYQEVQGRNASTL